MISGYLFEFERRQLLAVTMYWLSSLGDKKIDSLAETIIATLEEGRNERARQGTEPMSDFRGGLLSTAPRRADLIELAFQFWLERYKPWCALLDREGLEVAFSLTGWLDLSEAAPTSLVRLNAFLVESLAFSARSYQRQSSAWEAAARTLEKQASKHRSMTRGLASGSAHAKKTNLDRGAEKRGLILQAAYDYWRKNPKASTKEVAAFLADKPGYGKRSTIEKYLGGKRNDFLNSLAGKFK